MEKIVIVGFGWVGQANALALNQTGHTVFYYDIANPEQLYKNFKDGYLNIKRLANVGDQDGEDTCYVVCVKDGLNQDQSQEIRSIKTAIDSLSGLKGKVVLRSTVLPQHLKILRFDYYVPEFLHEKYAVEECLTMPHFVIGGESFNNLPSFLEEWGRRSKKIFKGTPEEASYIKYLSNVWNALRIAFVNEFGNLIYSETGKKENAERVIDFLFEKKEYLRYGKPYGGHCLPKDILSFSKAHEGTLGKIAPILSSINKSNELHKTLNENADLPEHFSKWSDIKEI